MHPTLMPGRDENSGVSALRVLAGALSRTAGTPLIANNHVRLLKDARENYPAWLEAIKAAQHHVHFESYIIYEDDAGREFADALIAKAREGVRVRLIYDWMGGLRKASRQFWNRLRVGGVEVRCYNPPRFDSPLGWTSRDHRKMLAVDGRIGFVTGLCVGKMWVGDSKRNIDPWRDTGVEVRGPAVSEIEQAFAQVWAMIGEPIRELEVVREDAAVTAGAMGVRIVASLPATAGMIRVDELVAALARIRLWLTDAYFAATSSYVQALRAAAKDGVDVRLLVPNTTDLPLLQPLSRMGYRPLLEAGVRVFEWNGTMIHAKTAVADQHWARVGSTNLNIASWFNNCELDAIVENDSFAREMEEMYLADLENSTEIVLHKGRTLPAYRANARHVPHSVGSAGRATAGVVRISNTVGAALIDRRVLGPIEARILIVAAVLLLGVSALVIFLPRLFAYVMAAVILWFAVALLYRGYRLHSKGQERAKTSDSDR